MIGELSGTGVLQIVLFIPIGILGIKHRLLANKPDSRGSDSLVAFGIMMALLATSGWVISLAADRTGFGKFMAVAGQALLLLIGVAVDRWAVGKLRRSDR